MGTFLVGIPVFITSSTKYSRTTSLTGAKVDKRARNVADPARKRSPAPPGQVEHSSSMGSIGPAARLAAPGVAPSRGELSQLAGQLDEPGGPSTAMRSSERPLY